MRGFRHWKSGLDKAIASRGNQTCLPLGGRFSKKKHEGHEIGAFPMRNWQELAGTQDLWTLLTTLGDFNRCETPTRQRREAQNTRQKGRKTKPKQ